MFISVNNVVDNLSVEIIVELTEYFMFIEGCRIVPFLQFIYEICYQMYTSEHTFCRSNRNKILLGRNDLLGINLKLEMIRV